MRGAGLFIGGYTANKLKWFTHDHDAHEDGWIRNLVRKQGHVAGWLWWVLLELFHNHGVGDVLRRDIADVAKAGLTSTSVVTRVLTEMATEFEGQSRLSWVLDGTELRLEIKKFRERQAKMKSKTLSKSLKTPLEGEGEREGERQREKHTPLPPKGGCYGFEEFWKAYPRKDAKQAALKSWGKISPTPDMLTAILAAVAKHRLRPDWTKENGQFIPMPSTWLNQRRWEDQGTSIIDPDPLPSMKDWANEMS